MKRKNSKAREDDERKLGTKEDREDEDVKMER
jgi:hypothetical protein